MNTGNKLKKRLARDFVKAKPAAVLSVGESVKLAREFNELSQNALSDLTGIPQSTISAIEKNRISLGVERAKVLARSLKVHPAVLLFPNWNTEKEIAA